MRYDPNDEYLYYKIGKLESEINKNYELGIEYFQKAISVNPKKILYWQAKRRNLYLLRRGPEAELCLKQCSKIEHERKLMFHAKSLMGSNNHEAALKCFNELIEINPDETDAYVGKGECLLNMNQSAQARNSFKEALRRINLSTRKNNYKKGKCLFYLDQYEGALNCFNEVIMSEPKNYSALLHIARLLGRLRRTEQATEAYHKIVEIENRDDDTLILRIKGIAFHMLGMTQQAVEAYDKILILYPNDSYALNKKGTFLDYLGRHNEAIECFDRVLKLDSKNVVCLCKKAFSYLKAGKLGEAKKYCETAEKISANNSFFWNLKGMLAYISYEYQESIICYNKSLELDNRYPVFSLGGKAVALAKLGSYNEALNCIDNALEFSPNNKYTLLAKGQILYEMKDFTNALACFDCVLEINPNEKDALLVKGQILYEMKDFTNALACFDCILGENDDFLDVLEWKGHSLARLGELAKAIECYSLVLYKGRNHSAKQVGLSTIKCLMNLFNPDPSDNFNVMIEPDRPFTNEMMFDKLLENCDDYILWLDKYFSTSSIKLLSRAINGKRVKTIRILSGIPNELGNLEELKDLFLKFRKEIEIISNIRVELRIMPREVAATVHDRWLISKNSCYNLPSVDVMKRGQFSEINPTINRPPFDELWYKSIDIVQGWNKISELCSSSSKSNHKHR